MHILPLSAKEIEERLSKVPVIKEEIVDQDYNPDSENAQSGKAVKDAIASTVLNTEVSGLATEDFVAAQIAAIPETDLTGLATEAFVNDLLDYRVEKVDGKGLSTNDFTTEEKAKLANIEAEANKTTIENTLTSDDITAALSAAQGKVLNDKIDAINSNLEDLGGGDMLKSRYDTDNDGIVDDAKKLDGHAVDYFATASDLNNQKDIAAEVVNKLSTKAEKINWNESSESSLSFIQNRTHYGVVSDPDVAGISQAGNGSGQHNSSQKISLQDFFGRSIEVHRYNGSNINEWYSLTVESVAQGSISVPGVEVSEKFKIHDDGEEFRTQWTPYGYLKVVEYDGNACQYDLYTDWSPAEKVLDPRYLPMNFVLSDVKKELDGFVTEDYVDETLNAIFEVIGPVIENKVDKEEGKGLSTNDFTNEYKTKLDNIDSTTTDSIVAITDEEIDTICAMTLIDMEVKETQ